MTSKLVSQTLPPRCRYRSSSGRRCKAAIHDHRQGFCLKHSDSLPAPQLPADFLQRLTTDCDEFTTAMGIHNSLSELYKLLAADLISARRAAVLAYIANLLLRTIPIVHSELNPDSDNEPVRVDADFARPNIGHTTTTAELKQGDTRIEGQSNGESGEKWRQNEVSCTTI